MPEQQRQQYSTRMNDEVSSPCIEICRIDPQTGWCEGCLRTLEEITEWRFSSVNEKREILSRISVRQKPTP
jgi:predicted Fe-S protein YdhL (DUF1289 family)